MDAFGTREMKAEWSIFETRMEDRIGCSLVGQIRQEEIEAQEARDGHPFLFFFFLAAGVSSDFSSMTSSVYKGFSSLILVPCYGG